MKILPDEIILNQIYLIREKKVMIDKDLANLYGVETRVLNQAVRRNIKRFPDDFMFVLTEEEFNDWKSQIVISSNMKRGLRKPPLVFTEHGVAMLSSILNSNRAIQVNIRIIRVFTKMRELAQSHKEILHQLEELQKKEIEQDEKILMIFRYLKKLEEEKKSMNPQKRQTRIGFRK